MIARYLSVTEVPHNTDLRVDGEETFLFFFQKRQTPNSNVKGSGANHYPGAPALNVLKLIGKSVFVGYYHDYRGFASVAICV